MKRALFTKAYKGLKEQASCSPLAKEKQELVGIYFATVGLVNSLPSLISHFPFDLLLAYK